MTHIHVEKSLKSPFLVVAYTLDGADSLQGRNVPPDTSLKNRNVVDPRLL